MNSAEEKTHKEIFFNLFEKGLYEAACHVIATTIDDKALWASNNAHLYSSKIEFVKDMRKNFGTTLQDSSEYYEKYKTKVDEN